MNMRYKTFASAQDAEMGLKYAHEIFQRLNPLVTAPLKDNALEILGRQGLDLVA
ncbi:MAG: hypothetical protein VKJ04_06030 [Vampirovibrionales bacterium]|nr:hypothetical protein [Vampirovibrionales bacterium]